jgi:glycosyltransferase involved in cell wall biosynthesis
MAGSWIALMKILLVAYSISPNRGSEAATAWGWATGLAAVHDVTVIARKNERDEVVRYFKETSKPQFKTVWVEQPHYSGPMAAQFNYLIWLRSVHRVCECLVRKNRFDLLHHVSYGSISAATRFWELDVPFVLGPLGGGQTLDPMFQGALGRMPLSDRLRNIRISLLHHRPAVRKMIRQARLVLVTNRETAELVNELGGEPILFNATGLRREFIRAEAHIKIRSEKFRMLWAGRMLYRKALPLAFYALKRTGRKDLTLDLVGDGPMIAKWKNLVKILHLEEQVRFCGKVSFSEVFDFYDRADLFVFPSVSDAFGSQLLEAAARGLPILTLDHQGADVLVPDGVAKKVAVGSLNQVIEDMAAAMLELANSPKSLAAMSRAAVEYARTELWPLRVERMSSLYERFTYPAGK